jgi:hypothetical protein
MIDNTRLTKGGAVPVPSGIAIRIVKMLNPCSTDAMIADEAFKVDAIIQMPQIQMALDVMKKRVAFESEQRAEAQRRLAIAEKSLAAMQKPEGLGELATEAVLLRTRVDEYAPLVKVLEDYVEYLHEAEKTYVLPRFLEMDNPPEIYPEEVRKKGHLLRKAIGALTRPWMLPPPAGEKKP